MSQDYGSVADPVTSRTLGSVLRCDINASASNGDSGTAISVDVKQAASTFGLPARIKHFKLARPQILSDGDIPLTIGIDTDFSTTVPTNIPSPVTVPYSAWDAGDWDTFYWADDPFAQPQVQGIVGTGTYGQMRLTGQISTENIRWVSTDIIYEPGGMV